MQIYLKQVLDSFFHSQSTVRHFALSVITLTLSQGLIHPVQVCSQPYTTFLCYSEYTMSCLQIDYVFSVCPTWLPWEQTRNQPWKTRQINNWWRLTRNIRASSTWVAAGSLFIHFKSGTIKYCNVFEILFIVCLSNSSDMQECCWAFLAIKIILSLYVFTDESCCWIEDVISGATGHKGIQRSNNPRFSPRWLRLCSLLSSLHISPREPTAQTGFPHFPA